MGVYGDTPIVRFGMHWQQQERYPGPVYDPSRDLSPNLPVHSCDSSSMGDIDPSLSNTSASTTSSSNCSTPTSNNAAPCSHRGYELGPHHRPPPCNNNCGSGGELCTRRPGFDRGGGFPDCDGGGGTFPQPPLLHPKIEHPAPCSPPSPPRCGDEAVVCAGCGHKISDRFYLLAVDRRWHASCLQCCQCRQTLDGEVTCFARDGNIYCKKDYNRLFGMKQCARCQATILSSELVMRARDLVFHVHCFTCAVCNAALTKGDHFGMRNGTVFCRLHYELSLTEHHHPSSAPFPGGGSYPPPFPSPEFHPHHHHTPPLSHSAPSGPDGAPSCKVSYFNGSTTGTGRQKGRPRKRKPKDLEAMTANLDLNADYLDVPFGRSGPGTPGSNGQRTKRMRTSFKHHQLRTMKSYFAINHNPDAKDLKQLSQKTGLPKRVLQVWFQNARAKWRRMVLKQEGKSVSGDKSDSGGPMGDLDSYSQHGGVTGDFHGQGLDPHSPQFILGGSSPSSLECA